mgnify:CR=1 FL=1
MSDIKELIGKRIQVIRKSRKLKQEVLAEMIGIEPQSLSYLENGKYAPSTDTLMKLSEVLKVSPYEFYYFETASEEEMKKEIKFAIDNNSKLLEFLYKIYKSFEYYIK